ncbi:SVSP family protein [Theileria parva strain Muguga]|uniref:Theileria-specific sub-telomeric protein, SVSP family n=1 Tax=Theileria parva TaxID=5875 RepID=Q4MYF7_THEPA|nr:SVSP family protein [Theileria parva strain Muguga]EAN30725.1 SVSP family protein [Theileria parva strain Muguga]|eukprot:XP_763008.1 hypothetical protein [Theileria parva strain Muguga]
MYKHIAYNFVLIFIIIQCVNSQDNVPDQPADDDDNFDVLDLDKIIEERLSRFDDPQYQPQYQQLQESQYPTQPQTQPQSQTQPQYYPGYQPETDQYQQEYQYYPGYQPESLEYQPEQYGQYQPYETQIQTQEQQYYVPPTSQPQPQVTQESQYQYYLPETTDPYGYQQPYETQTLYDIGQQPITETQPQVTQYQPVHHPFTYSDDTYGTQVTQALPQVTQPTQQPQYQYYQPTHTQTEVTQPPQTQSQTVEEDDNFCVTEHDQPVQEPSETETGFTYGQTQPTTQEPTQQSIEPQKEARKRTRTRSTSGDQGEEEDGEELVEVHPLISSEKSVHIKFYKRNNLGMLVEMCRKDYVVTFADSHKRKYRFKTNLEQIECNNEIIYVHTSGTPYCFSLSHSIRTDIIIITNIQGFVLIKKNYGKWTRTDFTIPDYVKMFTQDIGGNELLLTIDHYIIDLTSFGSFKYTFLPGIKCTKIIVKDMVAWKKSNKDDGFPEIIYVTPKLTVILNFEKYTKTFERRVNTYQLLRKRLNLKRPKYS